MLLYIIIFEDFQMTFQISTLLVSVRLEASPPSAAGITTAYFLATLRERYPDDMYH